jgi:integrase/recombinase XerD
MDALLNAPDQWTDQGRRDHALLLFLYNTGVRADEAAQAKILDLSIGHSPRDHSLVQIRGKGNKLRRCPLWPQTVGELSRLTARRQSADHVFLNRYGEPITRFGIHTMVERYVRKSLLAQHDKYLCGSGHGDEGQGSRNLRSAWAGCQNALEE